ncbi:MAG: PAS-domain containing protein, partial [Dongiaceae bacterium]
PAEWLSVEREIATLTTLQPTCVHEYEKPLPGGVTRWIRWLNRALFDGAGAVTEIQCVGHDVTDLKRLERELENGRELFALAVASSGDGIFDWNINTNEVWYSPRWKEMFGYGDDELPNTYETWDKLIHPDDKQKILDSVDAYFHNPAGVSRTQARYRHRNGSIVHIESRMIPRQAGEDGQLRVVGAYTDITAKVLAETRMRDAIESLSDGFAWFDADDRLIMHNERYLEFFPFLRGLGDLSGLPFIEMVRHPAGEMGRMPDPDGYVEARMKRHREGGSFELPLDNGGWVRVSERQTADRGIVSIWSDITELKQAQQRLLDAVAAMQEGFLLIGPDLKVILSNQRCREMYPVAGHLLMPGVAYEEFLRYAIAHGEFPEAQDRSEEFCTEMMNILRSRVDMRIERELAGGRWVLISQRGMSDGSVVGIRTDLTAQKLRETELEAAHDQLEEQASTLVDLAEKLEQARLSAVEASKAKTRFLAHMSHELRTPLNAILGFAKLIEDELFGPIGVPKYHEYVGLIHESGTHLLSLINDVLDLSKIEAGRMVLDRRGVSVEELAAASTRLMEGLAKDRGVKLRVEVLPGCRQVFGDERAIKQMIINLLSNALKFTPAGGRVTLSFAAWDDAAGENTIPAGDGNPHRGTAITVVDTGIGMSRDDIVKALDPFGQVDGEIARQHQGTGLGLPLVKAMAEAHGGWLSVDSMPGEGTTMTICLPGEAAATPLDNEGDNDQGIRGGGPVFIAALDLPLSDGTEAAITLPGVLPRVLLVEDNPINQRLFLDVLGNLPLRVDCVGDGEAAVDHARRSEYDLILMDIQMPKMGGIDAAQRIRASGDIGAQVPIVALTAHAMEGDRERYLAAGMTDYLTKPVDLLALIDMVTHYLGLDFSLTPA